jgi:hypothetical protein
LADLDTEDIAELAAEQIVDGVERHYGGGRNQFMPTTTALTARSCGVAMAVTPTTIG